MEKFNGTKFDLWNIKDDYFHGDRDIWDAKSGRKHIGMKYKEWVMLERKVRSRIKLSLVDSILLNIF
jgi:hypothetical protein